MYNVKLARLVSRSVTQRFHHLELASKQQVSYSTDDKNLFTQMDHFKICYPNGKKPRLSAR